MSYLAVLFQFVVVPIVALLLLGARDTQRGLSLPASLRLLPPRLVLGALVVIAVIYTTPWDNYLVATGVWWYDPALVLGITFGWVPLEEYLFFVLQSIMTGLWLLFLARRIRHETPFRARPAIRVTSTAAVAVVWVASLVILFSAWQPGTYLALELAWALPPIALQLAVGADILWHYRRIVVTALLTATLYLCGVDALAIGSGTWTIDPEQSLGFLVGGIMPLEEILFFLLTNTLLVFGLALGLAKESAARLPLQVRSKGYGVNSSS